MNKYRHIGFKMTPQRIAILDFLEGNKQHPSSMYIDRAVIKKFPTLSLATVYTTLAALKKRGNVSELTLDPDKKRYDPAPENHHHMICLSCKRIIDVPGEYQPDLPESAKRDFTIIQSHIEVRGLCADCKTDTIRTTKEAVHVRRS